MFNRMYLTVTEAVAAGLSRGTVFSDPAFMEQLDVTFASLWIEAYDADVHDVPRAWAALFERRHDRSVLPVQFALAGMNSHIGHDLAVAVIETCRQRDTSPGASPESGTTTRRSTSCSRPASPRSAGRSSPRPVGSWTLMSARWSIWSARGRSTRLVTSPGSTSRPCGRSGTWAAWPTATGPPWPAPSAWGRDSCSLRAAVTGAGPRAGNGGRSPIGGDVHDAAPLSSLHRRERPRPPRALLGRRPGPGDVRRPGRRPGAPTEGRDRPPDRVPDGRRSARPAGTRCTST